MAMKLLTFYNKFVANLPADDEENNLISLHIVQCPQAARS
jgi:hypothetical protein